ncbi:hypothetical protein ABT083_29660 [Streptomyces goshikiensis]
MSVSKRVAAFVAVAAAVFGFAVAGMASISGGSASVQAGSIINRP